MRISFLFFSLALLAGTLTARPGPIAGPILTGADQLSLYLPLLKGKAVAVFANQTSMVGRSHLVDTLLQCGIRIKKIFAPEHGFRGAADAGEQVSSQTDARTGLPIVSLYGSKLKPSPSDLRDVDILLFDIQDVGVRFYTYISSLQGYLESAVESHLPLVILDRPNPNGFYVDGPVLDMKFKSFVGMQPIPVVYGMTIGEYAKMLLGEQWVPNDHFAVTVIPCKNYTHNSRYSLPVKPSPNLPDMQSVYLYPSLCYFEGTAISLGRGTDKPFRQFGHPSFPKDLYSFTPASVEGARNPPLLGKTCYGYDLSKIDVEKETGRRLSLKWLIKAYRLYPDKDSFFLKGGAFFNRLAGTDALQRQLKEGRTEEEIRKSWAPGLDRFKKIRKKYLLYGDFGS